MLILTLVQIYLVITFVALVYNFVLVGLHMDESLDLFEELIGCVVLALCWPGMIAWMIKNRRWTVYD